MRRPWGKGRQPHLKVVLLHLAGVPAVQVEHADAAAHGDVVPVGVEGREVDHDGAETLLDLCGNGIEERVQRAELSERNGLGYGSHGRGVQRTCRRGQECFSGIEGNLGDEEQGIVTLPTSGQPKGKSCLAAGTGSFRVAKHHSWSTIRHEPVSLAPLLNICIQNGLWCVLAPVIYLVINTRGVERARKTVISSGL